MKLKLNDFIKPIELGEQATEEFLMQWDRARETMKQLLYLYEDEETRSALFYMLSLSDFVNDFIDFVLEGLKEEDLEELLNDYENAENEIQIDFGDDDEDEESEDE